MAQGRPSRGESITENIQDFVEESFQNRTALPNAGATRDHEQHGTLGAEPQTQASQSDQSMPQISPGTEAALEEHLAATENVRGAGQSGASNAGAADITSAAVQNEARQRMTDRTNDELGMGNIRS